VSRVIAWFSCGDASAVACKLALKRHPDAIIARIVIPNEHPDNERFASDCERWYGKKILCLQDPEKRETFDVWEKRRYIAGIHGAPCTGELKKAVRHEFEQPDDCRSLASPLTKPRGQSASRLTTLNCSFGSRLSNTA
jgi:hypothetical protein